MKLILQHISLYKQSAVSLLIFPCFYFPDPPGGYIPDNYKQMPRLLVIKGGKRNTCCKYLIIFLLKININLGRSFDIRQTRENISALFIRCTQVLQVVLQKIPPGISHTLFQPFVGKNYSAFAVCDQQGKACLFNHSLKQRHLRILGTGTK